jgi:hypothetical protein
VALPQAWSRLPWRLPQLRRRCPRPTARLQLLLHLLRRSRQTLPQQGGPGAHATDTCGVRIDLNPLQPAQERAPGFPRRSGPAQVGSGRDLLPWLDSSPHIGSGSASLDAPRLARFSLRAPALQGPFFSRAPVAAAARLLRDPDRPRASLRTSQRSRGRTRALLFLA